MPRIKRLPPEPIVAELEVLFDPKGNEQHVHQLVYSDGRVRELGQSLGARLAAEAARCFRESQGPR